MKKYFERTSIALIIVMMFISAIFGGEAITIHTNTDNTKYKTIVNVQGVKKEKATMQVELGNYISFNKRNMKQRLNNFSNMKFIRDISSLTNRNSIRRNLNINS